MNINFIQKVLILIFLITFTQTVYSNDLKELEVGAIYKAMSSPFVTQSYGDMQSALRMLEIDDVKAIRKMHDQKRFNVLKNGTEYVVIQKINNGKNPVYKIRIIGQLFYLYLWISPINNPVRVK